MASSPAWLSGVHPLRQLAFDPVGPDLFAALAKNANDPPPGDAHRMLPCEAVRNGRAHGRPCGTRWLDPNTVGTHGGPEHVAAGGPGGRDVVGDQPARRAGCHDGSDDRATPERAGGDDTWRPPDTRAPRSPYASIRGSAPHRAGSSRRRRPCSSVWALLLAAVNGFRHRQAQQARAPVRHRQGGPTIPLHWRQRRHPEGPEFSGHPAVRYANPTQGDKDLLCRIDSATPPKMAQGFLAARLAASPPQISNQS